MYQDVFANELTLWSQRGATLLDVRQAEEFALWRIPGSLNVPLQTLPECMGDLKEPIVMLCTSGNQAATTAELLCYAGLAQVGKLVGGIKAYAQMGYPVEGTVYLQ
jgi:rhodanese-related sulfurtransferase